MVQMTGRVLKSNNVNIEGKFHLGMSQMNSDYSGDMNTVMKEPHATIIESNQEYVVLQITCSCGQTIKIRGDYPKS